MKGYARSRVPDVSAALNTKALAYDQSAARSSTGGKPSWGGTGGGVAMTSDQQQQMLQLEERDADFDLQLDEIGEGIQDLAEIAQQQGEEVRLQTQMLDKVDKKIDKNLERMTTVNTWCLIYPTLTISCGCGATDSSIPPKPQRCLERQ